jgi:hypothetical protein
MSRKPSLGDLSPTLGAILSPFTFFYLNKISCFTSKKKKKPKER